MDQLKRLFNLRSSVLPLLWVAFLAGCGGGGLDPILGTPGVGALPTVTATTPVASSPAVTGVALTSAVSAAFSKDMASESLNSGSFTLSCPDGSPVRATVAYDTATRVATLTPEVALPAATTCVARLSTAVKDTLGLALASNFIWSFVTGPAPDLTPPTVVMMMPAAGAIGVPSNTQVTAVFSEDMRPASINNQSFTLVNTTLGTAVPGSVSYSATGRTAIFTPAAPATLAPNTAFTATITPAATDLAGNALVANVAWSFNTAALPDTSRPTVVLVLPTSGGTAVANNTAITATFSEDMNPASITATSFTLVNNSLSTLVPGSISYSATSRTAVFTPSTPALLAANTGFTATLTTAAADLAGNTLGANVVWTFNTAAAPDTTRPTVIANVPAANATGVPNNTAITVSFSEDMNPNSLSGSSFTLINATTGTAVAGNVSYSATGRTAVFTPATPATLAANSLFRATVTSAATDLAGNGLAANVVWTFTTAAAPDSTRPTLITNVPASNAAAVPTNTAITATFSEDMNPNSLSGSSFTLVNTTTGNAVAGTVSYAATGRTAIFSPSNPATLAANSSYRATVTAAAADLAGNGLAANVVWVFTTAAAPDTTRPTVVANVPASNATAVATTTAITATFSEDMNPTSLSSTSFTLVNASAGSAVAGNVSYSASSRTAVFTPSNPSTLPANTAFRATVSNAATDLAGNALAASVAWTFTTAALADTTRPTVVTTVPLNNATAVATNTQLAAVFSEDMNPASLTSTSFTLVNTSLGAAVPGNVSYAVGARTATFTPANGALLANNSSFTARISTVATDLSGNALAGNTAAATNAGDQVWSFTTAALADLVPPVITSVSPADSNASVCLSSAVGATFSEAMDPLTLNGNTFTVTDNGVNVAGTVSYNAQTRVASFAPVAAAGFAAGRLHVVTVKSGNQGAKDLAGNPLATDRSWNFTTSNQPCSIAINLRSAAAFGAFGGTAGVTNQGINTVVAGNLGSTAVCTAITGFHDASNVFTETPLNIGAVNGGVFCGPPAPGTTTSLAIATQARADAQTAFNDLAALPRGGDPGAGQLGGLVLPPSVYTAAGGSFAITNGDLTLDGQGNPNATWVFQAATALTVGQPGLPRRVVLINGASAANVYWQVGSAARIEDRSTMAGTIIANAGVTISTAGQGATTTLIGRAIGLIASVTMVNTTVVAP